MGRRVRDPKVRQDNAYLQQVLIDHHGLIIPAKSSQAGSSTTTGSAAHEIIVATSSSSNTQTLHASPSDGDMVTVKQQGTGVVTLDTDDSNTIDGETSIVYPIRYYGLTVMYTAEAGEWSIIHKVTPNTVMHS